MVNREHEPPIFGAVAQKYYDAGLPVIPLHFHEKNPAPKNWSQWHDSMPPEGQRNDWIQHLAPNNIGLVLGKQAGISMIDIDTEDQDLIRALQAILPPSPWVRIGKKGMVMAYRWSEGGPPTFRIKDIDGNTLIEHLGPRTQVVLPPSIHPDTKRPYSASSELVEVLDQLVPLRNDIEEILRGFFRDRGIELSTSGWTRVSDWVPAGSRDVKMTAVAGLYAYSVMRGERSLKEAIEMMRAWFEVNVEKVAGDDIDIDKGIRNIVRFVSRDVMEKGKQLPKGWDEGLSEEEKAQMGLNFTEDHEVWDYEQLKSYLHEQFENHGVASIGRQNAINHVLKKIALSAGAVDSMQQDQLFNYIRAAGGLDITKSAMRKRVRELETTGGDIRGVDHTELALATIKDLEQVSEIRFVGEAFWRWGGSHWEKMDRTEILGHIAREYGHLAAARRNSDHNGILKTIQNLLPQVLQTQYVQGVNFANGVLLQDGSLVPHDPSFGFTYTLPFRYLPDEADRCPMFMNFLETVWGEDEDYQDKVDALQEAICATIFGMGPKLQRAILLFGQASSGKSQLLEVISAMVPPEGRSACPPDQWSDKFAPVTMHQKVLNVCGELSKKKRIDGQKFKDIIDGNPTQMQYKGGQIFWAKPIATHWFASNHTPSTDDTSDGFNRRWLILTFTKPIDPKTRILEFGKLLVAEEREAIAAWAVQAMPRLLEKNEYTLPPSHQQMIREIATENNSVRHFLLDSGRVKSVMPPRGSGPLELAAADTPENRISETKLYQVYSSFCLGPGGARAVSQSQFRSRMRELTWFGFQIVIEDTEHGGQNCVYKYLTLVDPKKE